MMQHSTRFEQCERPSYSSDKIRHALHTHWTQLCHAFERRPIQIGVYAVRVRPQLKRADARRRRSPPSGQHSRWPRPRKSDPEEPGSQVAAIASDGTSVGGSALISTAKVPSLCIATEPRRKSHLLYTDQVRNLKQLQSTRTILPIVLAIVLLLLLLVPHATGDPCFALICLTLLAVFLFDKIESAEFYPSPDPVLPGRPLIRPSLFQRLPPALQS